MAIADVKEYTHLSTEEVEELGRSSTRSAPTSRSRAATTTRRTSTG